MTTRLTVDELFLVQTNLMDCGLWHECEGEGCEHRSTVYLRKEAVELCDECAEGLVGADAVKGRGLRHRCDEVDCGTRWTVKTANELLFCDRHARFYRPMSAAEVVRADPMLAASRGVMEPEELDS